MPQNLLAIHGVLGLVCAVGEDGRIMMFQGDIYHGQAVESPTRANLTAVQVFSPTCAYAVGEHGTVLRWDGEQWRPVALAGKRDDLLAIWGATEGDLWIGGKGVLIQRIGGTGSAITRTDSTITAIWGSGPEDVWMLCQGRQVMHWNGTGCHLHELPGEGDDLCAIGGGAPDEAVWIVGVGGLVLRGDGEGWEDMKSGTEATLTGVVALSEEDVWVTTSGGHLRHWNGGRWTTAAFSAFGPLTALCVVDGIVWACGAGEVVLQHKPEDGGHKE